MLKSKEVEVVTIEFNIGFRSSRLLRETRESEGNGSDKISVGSSSNLEWEDEPLRRVVCHNC